MKIKCNDYLINVWGLYWSEFVFPFHFNQRIWNRILENLRRFRLQKTFIGWFYYIGKITRPDVKISSGSSTTDNNANATTTANKPDLTRATEIKTDATTTFITTEQTENISTKLSSQSKSDTTTSASCLLAPSLMMCLLSVRSVATSFS